MEDAKSRLLNFLREFKSERVLFKMDEAMERLNISRKELEEALFVLEDEGYLKIIRIPPSELVIERLKARLRELDVSFVQGELTESEYVKKWQEIVDVTSREALTDLKPLPSQSLVDLLKALRAAYNYLERLREERGRIDDKVYRELFNEYLGEFLSLGKLIKRFVKASCIALRKVRSDLERLQTESEKLMLDSRIKGVDHRLEVEELERRAMKLLNRIKDIANRMGFSFQSDASHKENEALLKKLLEDFSRTDNLLKIVKARARIEGEDKYRDEIRRLENIMRDLNAKIEALRKELEAKPLDVEKRIFEELEFLKEKLRNLSMESINGEELRELVESLDLIILTYRVIKEATQMVENEGSILKSTHKLLAILEELPAADTRNC